MRSDIDESGKSMQPLPPYMQTVEPELTLEIGPPPDTPSFTGSNSPDAASAPVTFGKSWPLLSGGMLNAIQAVLRGCIHTLFHPILVPLTTRITEALVEETATVTTNPSMKCIVTIMAMISIWGIVGRPRARTLDGATPDSFWSGASRPSLTLGSLIMLIQWRMAKHPVTGMNRLIRMARTSSIIPFCLISPCSCAIKFLEIGTPKEESHILTPSPEKIL